MSIVLKVVTTTEFESEDAVEGFLKATGAFEPHQVVTLIEDKQMSVTEDRTVEGQVGPTINKFTLEEF